jgi:3-methyladenine DNA glycosylase/8-oxoguanine DNA glycosylase
VSRLGALTSCEAGAEGTVYPTASSKPPRSSRRGVEIVPVAALDAAASRAWVVAHLVPGVDRVVHHDDGRVDVTRLVPIDDDRAELTVSFPADPTDPIGWRGRGGRADRAVAAGHRWLGLDRDPGPAVAALAADPVLGPLVTSRPQIRVPGTTDPFETAVFVVLGQQVSLAAARRCAGRLVEAYGERHGIRSAFPRPEVLARVDAAELRAAVGLTGARARTVVAVARAVADGLDLCSRAARPSLLALPGIGPWTADLIAMRCARDPDVFLGGDLVIRRALGGVTATEADRQGLAWRPYRSLAVIHLWTHHVLDPPA